MPDTSLKQLIVIIVVSLLVVFQSTSTAAASFVFSTNKQRCNNKPQQPLLYNVLEEAPSDYDTDDLEDDKQTLKVDLDENDAVIRDELKRELLLLSSVTSRGEFSSREEKDVTIDLIMQLEALNPTANPAYNCEGDWELCLASCESFRSSPFFLSARSAFGDERSLAENSFKISKRLMLSTSKFGKVSQTITSSSMRSEIAVEMGVFPGIPLKTKGKVVTTADLQITGPEKWELRVKESTIDSNSSLPPIQIPVGSLYDRVRGSIPVATLKTFYVDEAIRITRDVDDNFFVFARV